MFSQWQIVVVWSDSDWLSAKLQVSGVIRITLTDYGPTSDRIIATDFTIEHLEIGRREENYGKEIFEKHCVLFVLKIMFVWIIRFFLAIKVNCAHITDKQITPVIRVILLCPVQRIQGEKSAGESQTHTKRTFSKTHLQQRCLLLLLWKYSLHSQWLLWSGLSKMASGALIPQVSRGTVSHCHNTIVSRGRIRPGINISNG